ncbi:MAG TPA: squalene/phytoene synthase family protein [Tepidisphaeraceae bacterium]|jgi:phytoene synthase
MGAVTSNTSFTVAPEDYAAAREIVRRSVPAVYNAAVHLPREKRQAVYALMAFAELTREAMEKSCESAPGEPAPAGGSCCSTSGIDELLATFAGRIEQMQAGALKLPAVAQRDASQHVLAALAETVRRCQIPAQYLIDFAAGFRVDAANRRYATWSRLEKYCWQHGGSLGMALAGILGVTHSDAANKLGRLAVAMQFTRLLVRIKSDWQRDHIYLPLEDLARFGYSERELGEGTTDARYRKLMEFEVQRARELYREGAQAILWLAGDGSRLMVANLTAMGLGVLKKLESAEYDASKRNVTIAIRERLWRLSAAWKLAKWNRGESAPAVFT